MEQKPTPLRLRTWLIVLLGTVLILPTLIWGLVYTVGLGSLTRGIILDNLKQRGDSHAELLARQLYLPWRHVAFLASTLELDDRESLRDLLTHLVETDERYLWLGVVQTDGDVLAASSGHMKHVNMTGRDWFETGLQEPFAGEPHTDAALAEMLPPRAETYLFFDYAVPIRNAEGEVVAVLGAHFDWSLVKASLSRFYGEEVQTLLLDRNGKVLIGPDGLTGERLPLDTAVASTRAAPRLRVRTWPDDKTYVSITVPNLTYADMPSPGFSLVVRQDAEQAFAPLRRLIRHFWQAVALGAVLMLAVIVALSWWIAAPITGFARFARDLADGCAGPPPEHHGYREADELSAALSRLQCRLRAPEPAEPAGPPQQNTQMVHSLGR